MRLRLVLTRMEVWNRRRDKRSRMDGRMSVKNKRSARIGTKEGDTDRKLVDCSGCYNHDCCCCRRCCCAADCDS